MAAIVMAEPRRRKPADGMYVLGSDAARRVGDGVHA